MNTRKKTIRDIADMLGVEKQKAYRYIKKQHTDLLNQETGVMRFDSEAVKAIIKGYNSIYLDNNSIDADVSYPDASCEEPIKHKKALYEEINTCQNTSCEDKINKHASSENYINMLIETLKKENETLCKEIEFKNNQLTDLAAALLAAQRQAEGAQFLHTNTMKHIESKQETRKGFFKRLFGKRTEEGQG